MCSTSEGLFETLAIKFRLQFNETIKSLQFCKLNRQDGKSTEEWMGRLRVSVVDCNYQKLNRQLKEQFIHGLNDTEMLGEIIWELTKIMENGIIMSENILAWAKRVEAQRAQSTVIKQYY